MNTHTPKDTVSEEPQSRRDALKAALKVLGVAGAGLAGGHLLLGSNAEAANGDPLIVGSSANAASAPTVLSSSVGAGAVGFEVDALAADDGVLGFGGISGVGGAGLFGMFGFGAVGGVFVAADESTDSALWLAPRSTPGTPGGGHAVGEMVVDSNGILHLCVAAGTPGTWITNGGQQLLDSPQRVFDTRVSGPKLATDGTRTFDIPALTAGVPPAALAVVANLTVTQTVGGGYVTAYPDGTAKPSTANVNWTSSGQTVGNSATVRLGTGSRIKVYSFRSTHLTLG